MNLAFSEIEYQWLADFIGQNWTAFLGFMEEREIDEPGCEDFCKRLEDAAGI